MATIVLAAAGAAVGGTVGGTVLGLSMTAVGRFAGSLIGRSIDQRLLGQGSDIVEMGRVNRLRLSGAGEGDPIAQVYGRMRVPGQVIWATEFLETVAVSGGGGKGAPSGPKTANYSYSVSMAIALCEGEISHVGRIWADGSEIARDRLTMRVYSGAMDQVPDPKIEAVEGAGTAPAYRGTAYVVIEDLDLSEFGNRVPQFSFEVFRPAQKNLPGSDLDPAHALRGVALLPGSGEYALATTPVRMNFGPGSTPLANVNSPSAKPDFLTALDNLKGELPGNRSVSLIVSWFGDDLRCGECSLRPKVEQNQYDGSNMPWQVAGLNRATAELVSKDSAGQSNYGGTPTDQSVVEAITALKEAGQDVMYYPFILMDQAEDNGLPDPYSDAPDQAVLPWRGRITVSSAPGRAASPDMSAVAEVEVASFFGTATAADFEFPEQPDPFSGASGENNENKPFDLLIEHSTGSHSPVNYTGPDDWGYRRFILHQAKLCEAAGGVESFCIGSEMRGLTTIRGAGGSFPAVQALRDLAAEVRLILGSDTQITYAADWSEYSGYQPQDGSGDRYFHLDPLWADDNIDFIGIDNYMPLSDWRDGSDHADAKWGAIHDLGYLQANIEGGEGYDWFYHSDEARAAQIRTPITDDEHEEPWIWRVKDVRNWWLNPHHERIGGERQAQQTAWVPQSKPIRFTEFGCAAIDKGTNQPNRFLDPKSDESGLPHFSNGMRDELIQFQYLRAMQGYWSDPANNPTSDEYGAPMLDMEHAYAWAWDARPFPSFPGNQALWSDGANYARGHWISGRMSAWRLASVVNAACESVGLVECDTSDLHGIIRGYHIDQVADARAILQPLMLRHGFDAVERDGTLKFLLRDGVTDHSVDPDTLVRDDEIDGVIEETRSNVNELSGRVRLRFIEEGADYEVIAEESILPDAQSHAVSTSEMPLLMTRAEGRQTVERWLSEARIATDTVRLTLPPSQLEIGAGEVIKLPNENGGGLFRIDRVDVMANAQKVEAVRIEPESYRPVEIEADEPVVRSFSVPAPVTSFFMDLPLLTGDEVPHAPHLAVIGDPWPGSAALYSSDEDANYRLNKVVVARNPVGITETALSPACIGRIDRGAGLRVRMLNGALESVSDAAFLSGANLCAIGDGSPDGWELFQFRDAELVAKDSYLLQHRLRGQLGTEQTDAWPAGSYIVRLDGTPQQIELSESQLGQPRNYRIGPASRPVDDFAYRHAIIAFDGIGLRPLSPVHLRLTGDAGSERTLSWIRRTRVGGDRWETPDVPLGEETETYIVRVMQGGEILREEAVQAPEWVYSAAAQAADNITGLYELHVAQVSALFGAGVFARFNVPA